ncbi:hypothetical protein ACFYWX_09195 [Streptomyces sp. NPDC002888]
MPHSDSTARKTVGGRAMVNLSKKQRMEASATCAPHLLSKAG